MIGASTNEAAGKRGAARLAAAGVRVGNGVRAWLGDTVCVGNDVLIGDGATLVADTLELGDGVEIGPGCDVRASVLRLGSGTELQEHVRVLVADDFALGRGSRLESSVSLTCRRFTTGDLFYLGNESIVGYGGTTTSTSVFQAGDRVAIGPHSILNANRLITFEDDAGSGCYLSVWTHGFHFGHRLLDGHDATFADVHIGRNVWLGYHATVLPGVRIGANTILAAGAVAARNLPADVLAAGVPAVVKRPLNATPLQGEPAHRRVAELLDAWVTELRWKEMAVAREPGGDLLLGAGHRVRLVPAGDPPPRPDGRRLLLLTIEDRPDLRSLPDSVLFELRSGGKHGSLDDVGHDLRDFLRRNALPCGSAETFRSLPPRAFDRLRNPGETEDGRLPASAP
jgi:acetyltransferase-like isoleucine patch superfamily enzyme